MRWCYLIVVIDRHRWKGVLQIKVSTDVAGIKEKLFKNILIPF